MTGTTARPLELCATVPVRVRVPAGVLDGAVRLGFDRRSPWAVDAVLVPPLTGPPLALPRDGLDRATRGRYRTQALQLWATPLGRVAPEVLHLRTAACPTADWTFPLATVRAFLACTFWVVPRGAGEPTADFVDELRALLPH